MVEPYEIFTLKQENDKLRIENIALEEEVRNPICTSRGGQASLGEISIEEQHLGAENARLREECNRLHMMASKYLSRPVSSLIASIDPSMFIQLAVNAMNELVKLAQVGSPMWLNSSNRSGETLNIEEYHRAFFPCIGMKPSAFSTQATRASGTVMINSKALIEILMDSKQFAEIFPNIIGRAATIDIISSGIGGTRNGVLQLMQAQFQVLSPLVPVRELKFLRFCEQRVEGIWAVVDVSIDAGGNGGCRRLPSGCLIQDMPNGRSKVIWVEHMEYDESDVHPCFHPLLKSGIGFGAQRWVTNLERQCELLAFLIYITSPDRNLSVNNHRVSLKIRRLGYFAQRMTHNFCSGICGTSHKWDIVQAGNSEHAKVMIRNSNGNAGEPPGVILSASLTVLMPVSHHHIFEFLQSEQTRPQWDLLFHDSAVQNMLQIPTRQELGNSISLLRANVANRNGNGNESRILVFQDTCTDISGSMIVYAPVDNARINLVMSGRDSNFVVPILPSGFVIFPVISQESNTRPSSSNGFVVEERGGGGGGGGRGCLLTVGFQIPVSNLPSARLMAESVGMVNTLISRTVQTINTCLVDGYVYLA